LAFAFENGVLRRKKKFGIFADMLQGALPAIALTQHSTLSTAVANDVDPKTVFARQVWIAAGEIALWQSALPARLETSFSDHKNRACSMKSTWSGSKVHDHTP